MARIPASEIKRGDTIEIWPHVDLVVEWTGVTNGGMAYLAGHKSTNGEPCVIQVDHQAHYEVEEDNHGT